MSQIHTPMFESPASSVPSTSTSSISSSRRGSLRERCGFTLWLSFAPAFPNIPAKGAIGPTAGNLPRRKRSSVVSLDLPVPVDLSVGRSEYFAANIPCIFEKKHTMRLMPPGGVNPIHHKGGMNEGDRHGPRRLHTDSATINYSDVNLGMNGRANGRDAIVCGKKTLLNRTEWHDTAGRNQTSISLIRLRSIAKLDEGDRHGSTAAVIHSDVSVGMSGRGMQRVPTFIEEELSAQQPKSTCFSRELEKKCFSDRCEGTGHDMRENAQDDIMPPGGIEPSLLDTELEIE
ncbi:hypothetical protein DFH09DRAFT_1076867 [Mycena vulgaris]|nr:hypothetical protein DFH09DRAFT_1076867 [Mycena vulgaris]